ncbi:MAG: hypothetical protein CUN55_01100 [Phototrophicales bacterium]|nr:MAG: hypothetical protein CUN55_01100 [Phototrophicales bacterium]
MDTILNFFDKILQPIFEITTTLIQPILDQLQVIGLSGSVVNFMLIAAILGISIYFTLYCGMFSLANAGFMAIGAYIGAILTTQHDASLGEALIWGMFAGGLIALIIGVPMLRLKNIYLAIATIGFGEVVRILIREFDQLMGNLRDDPTVGGIVRDILGLLVEDVDARRLRITYGPQGITRIPRETEVAHLVVFLLVLAYFLYRFHHSRMGRAMAAIRQDERVAASQGINVVYYKNVAFFIGAIIASAAGVFSAHTIGTIGPEDYDFGRAVDILAYAVLGGLGSWVGPIIGGLTLEAMPEILRELKEYTGLINGLILLLIIIYLPGGLTSLFRPSFWLSRGRFDTAQRVVTAGIVLVAICNVLPYRLEAGAQGRVLGYEVWGLLPAFISVGVAFFLVQRISPKPEGGRYSVLLAGVAAGVWLAFLILGLVGQIENVTTGYYLHLIGMALIVGGALISYPPEIEAASQRKPEVA